MEINNLEVGDRVVIDPTRDSLLLAQDERYQHSPFVVRQTLPPVSPRGYAGPLVIIEDAKGNIVKNANNDGPMLLSSYYLRKA